MSFRGSKSKCQIALFRHLGRPRNTQVILS
jgi:hypothetical protein